MALRDTGCTCLIVQENLVTEDQYINEKQVITLGDGTTIECKCAIVNIDTPWLSGDVKACVMPKCTAPLLIGNLTTAKPDNFLETYEDWIKEKKYPNINKPVTLDEYNCNAIEQMTQSLNLLKSNNIDTNKWIQNLQPVLLQKESDTKLYFQNGIGHNLLALT